MYETFVINIPSNLSLDILVVKYISIRYSSNMLSTSIKMQMCEISIECDIPLRIIIIITYNI